MIYWNYSEINSELSYYSPKIYDVCVIDKQIARWTILNSIY